MASNSTKSLELIFLTGATGFLGSHILIQMLKQGYRVRTLVREKKVSQFKFMYQRFGDQLDVVPIVDIATDQLPDAFKGVTAVIHTAAPLGLGRVNNIDELVKGAVDGALNVIRQAEKAGITRIVLTSSFATVINPQYQLTEQGNRIVVINSQYTPTDQDWYSVDTREKARGSQLHGVDAYRAAKTIAEKEVWKFAESHPHVDITVLNPHIFYGPFAEGFSLPTPDYYALSTNLYYYRLTVPNGVYPMSSFYIDVRDIAKAHILALNAPSASIVGRKRIIIASPHEVDYNEVIDLIKTKRPELADRLIKTPPPVYSGKKLPYNSKRVEEVLGMKESDFASLESTILETIDSVLAFEKQWMDAGFKIDIPLE
ncbi:hypothetical protein BDP27DRAFT_1356763 [Rhodocollybia butyracea]|uniref:NAD-dependent epimerase/dehydratase domain-containing protein n=1 Tax=Rhodocollybia butyracea TaxID=206335 RepID=A0A9P5QAA6_9AGAR|nr:hypothetical protein BDP27DRAFT_1356763 [Rhodocollybia butyracea]